MLEYKPNRLKQYMILMIKIKPIYWILIYLSDLFDIQRYFLISNIYFLPKIICKTYNPIPKLTFEAFIILFSPNKDFVSPNPIPYLFNLDQKYSKYFLTRSLTLYYNSHLVPNHIELYISDYFSVVFSHKMHRVIPQNLRHLIILVQQSFPKDECDNFEFM
jgi:hypothetical protein